MYVSIKTFACVGIALWFALNSSDALSDENAAKTSVFNEQWLDAVVSLELTVKQQAPRPIGTGFLVQTKRQHILLVTAKHVIAPAGEILSGLAYRLNERGAPSVLVADTELQGKGLGRWFLSSSHDVACRFIAWRETSQIVAIPIEQFLIHDKIQAGTPLLILGFPLGLRSADHASPIARHGIVARSDSSLIIADVFVFSGNSGGPVIYVPQIKVGGALKSPLINEEKLIGLVSSYIPYQEPAISVHTQRPRVVFEENSGLANLVPADAISNLMSQEDVRMLDEALAEKRDAGYNYNPPLQGMLTPFALLRGTPSRSLCHAT